jgi:hypothetical protein
MVERRINPFRGLGKRNKDMLISLFKFKGKEPFSLRDVREIVSSSQNLRVLKDNGKLRKVGYRSGKDASVLWRIPEDLAIALDKYLEEQKSKPLA